MFDKYKEKRKEYRYWGMTKGDLIRLVFMVGVFIFVFAMMIFVLPRMIPPPPGKGGEEHVRLHPPQRVGEPGALELLEKIKREKLRQLRQAKEKLPEPTQPFKPDPELMAAVKDDDYVADLKGVIHLLHRLTWQKGPLAGEGKISEALKEPSKWRGRAVRLEGRLLSLQKKKLRENPSGLKYVWLANIKTETGRVVCYFYQKRSVFASAEDFPEYEGDTVAAKGLFLQRLREGVGVVVARSLERTGYGPGRPAEPQKPCEKLDRKVLERVEDGAPELDQKALLHTLLWLNSQIPFEFERWFLRNCWRIDKALANYTQSRFGPVWVDGNLTQLKLHHLPENPSGVEWLYEGVLQTEVTEEPVVVLFFEQERELHLQRGEESDLLRVKGILMGRLRRSGPAGEVVKTPVVVARKLEFLGDRGGSTPPLIPFKEDPKIWEQAPVRADEPWEKGVEYALHYINSMPYQEFITLARKKAIWIGTAFDAPQRNLGKLVWVEGNLNRCDEGPNADSLSGVNRYLFGQIYCFQTRNNYIWFVCWEKERDFNAYRSKDVPGDPVRLYGIFVCTWVARYPSGIKIEIPVVVGRRLLAAPQPDMFAQFPWGWMLAIGGAIFALMLFFIVRSRQEIKATDEILRRVRAKMAEAASQKKEGEKPKTAQEKPSQKAQEQKEKPDSQQKE